MKILIINPNSDQNMTAAIQKTAEDFSAGEFKVLCQPTPNAPSFIETYEDTALAAIGMVDLVRKNQDTCDAFIVACHCDPNLDVLKEITTKPVVGIGEASMKIASMLGHRFSVLSTDIHSIPIKEELIRKYHLQEMMASVRAPGKDISEIDLEKKFMNIALSAMEEDGAEVIVLGCAGLTGLDKLLQKKLNVPVLDGVKCALIIAAGLVRHGISTSKKKRYNPERTCE